MVARVWVMCCVGVAAFVSAGGHAEAADPTSLKEALFGRPELEAAPPVVARYEGEDGEAFIFDRIGRNEALLKFDADPEVWVLKPTPGPRGDMIYKNDVGEPVVRATRIGGLTLFTSDRPSGLAAAFIGQAPRPHPPMPTGPEAFTQLVIQASARVSRVCQHLVEFDVPEVTPASEAMFAQAVVITSEAFVRVNQRGHGGQVTLTRFVAVHILPGKGPDAEARGQVVQITVAPQLGMAGRPSSERIAEVISKP